MLRFACRTQARITDGYAVETHDITPRTPDLSRRDVLLGGLFFGGLFLSGCGGSQNSGLPGPRYAFEGGVGPDVTRNTVVTAAPLPAAPTPAPTVEVPTNVMSRSQWTRSGVARVKEANPMNGIRRITVHHDAIVSTDLRTGSDVTRRLESIRRSHVQRGWADIGYHFAIDPHGRVWEARSTGLQGAHVEHNNENNLGIVLLGNFDAHAPTSAATASLNRFVASQMQRYSVPLSRVYTHRELKPTACPGSRLQRFMVETRNRSGGLYMMST